MDAKLYHLHIFSHIFLSSESSNIEWWKARKKLFIFFLPFLFYFCPDTRLEVVLINENEYDNDQCLAEKMSIYFICMRSTTDNHNKQSALLIPLGKVVEPGSGHVKSQGRKLFAGIRYVSTFINPVWIKPE